MESVQWHCLNPSHGDGTIPESPWLGCDVLIAPWILLYPSIDGSVFLSAKRALGSGFRNAEIVEKNGVLQDRGFILK